MKFVNPLPFVENIKVSKFFYSELLGLQILEEHENFIRFECGFAIHDGLSLLKSVFGASKPNNSNYGRQNFVLYFEEIRLEAVFKRLLPHVEMIHDIREEDWGQRIFRLYDPDRHIVEIGDPF